jgi:hypothetical protein
MPLVDPKIFLPGLGDNVYFSRRDKVAEVLAVGFK